MLCSIVPGSGLCGEGASPLPCPHPLDDSHHGPLPGASLGYRSRDGIVPFASFARERERPAITPTHPQGRVKWCTKALCALLTATSPFTALSSSPSPGPAAAYE